jgi:Tfp pilus assembly protein PilV
MKKRKRSIAAFSLVELTIALGVIGFCLLTIIGLLAVGINSTHSSTEQTSATNILTAFISDLEAVPNITPSYGAAKGTIATPNGSASGSPIYNMTFPAGGNGATSTYKFYVGDNGLTNTTAAASFYQVNIWITASNTNSTASTQPHQETFARVLITWPAPAAYTNAQGYVEDVVAINRT